MHASLAGERSSSPLAELCCGGNERMGVSLSVSSLCSTTATSGTERYPRVGGTRNGAEKQTAELLSGQSCRRQWGRAPYAGVPTGALFRCTAAAFAGAVLTFRLSGIFLFVTSASATLSVILFVVSQH